MYSCKITRYGCVGGTGKAKVMYSRVLTDLGIVACT